jgi:hypothetical protein
MISDENLIGPDGKAEGGRSGQTFLATTVGGGMIFSPDHASPGTPEMPYTNFPAAGLPGSCQWIAR